MNGPRTSIGAARHAIRRRRAPDRWTLSSPFRVLRVPADAVGHAVAPRLPEELRGRRHPGAWDLDPIVVDDLPLARALHRRFVDAASWEDTGLVEAGGALAAARLGTRYLQMDAAALRERCDTLDALHAALQRTGWLPHHRIGAPFEREMSVAVGRDGRLLRNRGGLHRLIIARILGLEEVPLRVVVEHPSLSEIPDVLRRGG